LLYTRTQINALNGEWRLGVQLGDEPSLSTDIYQPLDPLNRYFVSGRAVYQSRQANTFDNDGNKLSRYNFYSSLQSKGIKSKQATDRNRVFVGYKSTAPVC
jgi:hypothetical protein